MIIEPPINKLLSIVDRIEIKRNDLGGNTIIVNKGKHSIRLFEKCFEILGTRKPLLTVSEENLPQFERILITSDFL